MNTSDEPLFNTCGVRVGESPFGAVACDDVHCLIGAVPTEAQCGVGKHDRAATALVIVDKHTGLGVCREDLGGEVRGRRP